MTAARCAWKRHVIGAVLSLALGVGFAASCLAALRAATTERVVVDRHTGLAIYGIDPVGYFTERKPVPGRQEFEFRYAGAIWRFEHAGNRAALGADPDVYTPRYGGYDPVGISRGRATPGIPALWAVVGQRLYLFYTAEARRAFLAAPASLIAGASARWE